MFDIGFDYYLFQTYGIKLPLSAPLGHLIVTGGSGSGKSTALLYWLAKMKKIDIPIELYIMDFKASHEFEGITDSYAEYEACYQKIVEFYDMFSTLEEGGDGTVKILLIDEIAGLLTHLGMSKEGKVQIPLHRITDSASNGSVFPVVTEHFSASSDHAFL